jgi:hypothetical protein
VLNLIAAACILVSLLKDFNFYFALTEIVWAILSIVGIVRVFYVQNFVRFSNMESRALAIIAPNIGKDLGRKLIGIARRVEIAPGTALTKEGGRVESLSVLLGGTCSVVKGGVEVALLRSGAIIGDMTYATGANATASVSAVSHCDAFMFDAEQMRRLIAANPQIGAHLELGSAASMRQKLKETTEHIARTKDQS